MNPLEGVLRKGPLQYQVIVNPGIEVEVARFYVRELTGHYLLTERRTSGDLRRQHPHSDGATSEDVFDVAHIGDPEETVMGALKARAIDYCKARTGSGEFSSWTESDR